MKVNLDSCFEKFCTYFLFNVKKWTRPFDGKKATDIDASILTGHMMLEATELGLGSVWICYFKPDVLSDELVSFESL